MCGSVHSVSRVPLDNLVGAHYEAARVCINFPGPAIIPCVVNGVIMINWRHGGHGRGELNVSP